MLNIDPKQIIEIFENYDDHNTWTVCFWTVKETDSGKTYKCKDWQRIPANDGKQLAEVLNKTKREQEEFERRNGGGDPTNSRGRAEQHEREIFRRVRGQKIP
jgi:hypothetical protein